MKDIPLFEAEGGLASLVLSQIPQKKAAWVVVHTAAPEKLSDLLAQCRSACRVCGAERIFVRFDLAKDRDRAGLPHVYDLLRLDGDRAALGPPAGTLVLRPISSGEGPDLVRAYNDIFRDSIHARLYRPTEAPLLLDQSRAFGAVMPAGGEASPVGLGLVAEQELLALGLLSAHRGRGLGRELVRLLAAQADAGTVFVRTTSENKAALGLYRSLGFTLTGTEEQWYQLS